jgi:hypothetical protein
MLQASFDSVGPLLTVLTPLVAVPLTVITFYLRSLREHQVTRHAESIRRIEANEIGLRDLRKNLSEFERDYAGKEEWLRESLGTRHQIGRLKEAVIRMETAIEARSEPRMLTAGPPSPGAPLGTEPPAARAAWDKETD